MLPVGAYAEPSAPANELLPSAARGRVVHADVEQMDARRVLGVEPSDVGQRPGRFDHDGHAMELVMAGMKHVPAQAAAPAPKCFSKAFTRSPAID
jgi:hypothetical protein